MKQNQEISPKKGFSRALSSFRNSLRCVLCNAELDDIFDDTKTMDGYQCKSCFAIFPLKEGAPDFRFDIVNLNNSELWKKTQENYEHFVWNYDIEQARIDDAANAEIYKRHHLCGRVLDIGGGQGFLRKYLSQESEYLCIDPWPDARIHAFKLSCGKEFPALYDFLHEDFAFLIGFGEGLPLVSVSFDWVHIRSVLDHAFDPERVLRESIRILKKNGRLLLNSSATDGPKVADSIRPSIFYRAYKRFRSEGIHAVVKKVSCLLRGRDSDHICHPTSEQLMSMVRKVGFKVVEAGWISDITGIQGDFLLAGIKEEN